MQVNNSEFTMGLSNASDNIPRKSEGLLPKEPLSQDIVTVQTTTQNNISNALIASTIEKNGKSIETFTSKRTRIHLVRHYPYIDEERKELGVHRTLGNLLEKDRIRLRASYDGIFIQPNRTLIIYDKTEQLSRSRPTAEDLIQHYSIPEKNIIRDICLEGTPDSAEDKLLRNVRTTNEIIELREMIKNRDLSDIDSIVIIGNRTYRNAFDDMVGGKNDMTRELLKEKGYLFRDFDVSMKPIIPSDTSLIIHPEDYQSFQKIFSEIKNNSPQELQSKIETLFANDPSLYQIYLSDPLLCTFCLANLIMQQDYAAIESYYLSVDSISLSKEEKRLLLQNTIDEKIMKILRRLFVCKDELWENGDEIIINTYIGSVRYNEMKENQERYQKILESSNKCAKNIFENSIDTTIKAGKGFIPRGLYTFQKKSKDELGKLQESTQGAIKENEYNRNSIDLEAILQSSLATHILLGHVGDGKSTELAKMKFEISTHPKYNKYITLFYSAKENGTNPIETIDQEITFIHSVSPEKKIVMFFDGIDELNISIRKNLVVFLRNLSSISDNTFIKIIMGSRPSGFDVYEDGVIYFEILSSERIREFISSRLENLGKETNNKALLVNKKINEVMNFLEKDILDKSLKNTPLILFFLCRLCISDELSGIKNRIDLYEKIITLILSEHQGNRDGKKSKLDDTNKKLLFDTLGYCAYKKSISPGESLKAEDILIYLETEQDIIHETTRNDILDQIFLLYRLQGGGYEFILKSFEEYFISQYRNTLVMKNNSGLEKWNTALQANESVGLTGLLISTGNMDFASFEKDAKYIIGQGGDIPLLEILQSIVDIGSIDAYDLLMKISTLEEFKKNKNAIESFFTVIETIWYKKDTEIAKHKSYSLLEKIIDIESIKEDADIVWKLIGAMSATKVLFMFNGAFFNKIIDFPITREDPNIIYKLGVSLYYGVIHDKAHIDDSDTLLFLEKILFTPAFSKALDLREIELFSYLINWIKDPQEMYRFIRILLRLDTYKDNIGAVSNICYALSEINNLEMYLDLLREISNLPIFTTNSDKTLDQTLTFKPRFADIPIGTRYGDIIIDSLILSLKSNFDNKGKMYLGMLDGIMHLEIFRMNQDILSNIIDSFDFEWPSNLLKNYFDLLISLIENNNIDIKENSLYELTHIIATNSINDIEGNYHKLISVLINKNIYKNDSYHMQPLLELVKLKDDKPLFEEIINFFQIETEKTITKNDQWGIIQNLVFMAITCCYFHMGKQAIFFIEKFFYLIQVEDPGHIETQLKNIVDNPKLEEIRNHPDFISIIGKYYILSISESNNITL